VSHDQPGGGLVYQGEKDVGSRDVHTCGALIHWRSCLVTLSSQRIRDQIVNFTSNLCEGACVMLRAILAVGVIAAFAAPAHAEEYYIVHGSDLRCRVVNHIPEDHTTVRVGPIGFRTRVEAEREMGIVCRANGYYRDEEPREG
jgi:hypothetical protein